MNYKEQKKGKSNKRQTFKPKNNSYSSTQINDTVSVISNKLDKEYGISSGKRYNDYLSETNAGETKIYPGLSSMKLNHPQWYGGNKQYSSGATLAVRDTTRAYALLHVMSAYINFNIPSNPASVTMTGLINDQVVQFDKLFGYPTNITVQQVVEAISANINLAVAFKVARRMYNTAEEIIFGNIKYKEHYQYMNPIKQSSGLPGPVVNSTIDSIGNKEWNDTVIAPGKRLQLSQNAKEFIDYHCDNLFVTTSATAGNAILEFNTLHQHLGTRGFLSLYLNAWETKMSANVLLKDFLHFIGLTRNYEYEELVRSTTPDYSLIEDPLMINAWSNDENEDWRTNGIVMPLDAIDISPFGVSSLINRSIGDVTKAMKFNFFGIELTYASTLLRTNSNVLTWLDNTANGVTRNDYSNIQTFPRIQRRIDYITVDNAAIKLHAEQWANIVAKNLTPADVLGYQESNLVIRTLAVISNGAGTVSDSNAYHIFRSVGLDAYVDPDLELVAEVALTHLVLGSYPETKVSDNNGNRKVALQKQHT